MKPTLLFLGIALLLTLMVSADTNLPYPLAPLSFTGNLGGFDVVLNGTIDQMVDQLANQAPGYPSYKNTTAIALAQAENTALESRSHSANDVLCCPIAQWKWGWATRTIIQKYSQAKMDAINFPIQIPANHCSLIDCTYESAAYVCNDLNRPVYPHGTTLGGMIADILVKCFEWDKNVGYKSCGQLFDTDGFNIVVRWIKNCVGS